MGIWITAICISTLMAFRSDMNSIRTRYRMQKIQLKQSLLDVSVTQGSNLNLNKPCLMIFGSKAKRQELQGKLNLRVSGTHVRFSESCKPLGLELDKHLRFGSHVTKLCQCSYLTLKQLNPSRHVISPEIKLNICKSLILSSLSYCGHSLCSIRTYEREISTKRFIIKAVADGNFTPVPFAVLDS